jgi:hypothetical protein
MDMNKKIIEKTKKKKIKGYQTAVVELKTLDDSIAIAAADLQIKIVESAIKMMPEGKQSPPAIIQVSTQLLHITLSQILEHFVPIVYSNLEVRSGKKGIKMVDGEADISDIFKKIDETKDRGLG